MNKKTARENPTVFTTEQGRICPKCQKPVTECICKKMVTLPAGDGIIRIALQTKGRKGKKVTLISGFILPAEELYRLATDLKRKCGAGGTVDGSTLEIQGDFRQKIARELVKVGFKVKQVGG